MGSSDAREARNEAATRGLNEGIEAAHEEAGRKGYVRMLCECGAESCDRMVAMTLDEYERVRAKAHRFVLARGHEIERIETVVERNDRFIVAEKGEGTPAVIAEEQDPRS